MDAHSYAIFSTYAFSESVGSKGNGSYSIGANYGINDRLAIGLSVPYSFVAGGYRGERGFDDINFGFQYYLTQFGTVKVGSAFGVRPATAINNGILSNGATDYSGELIMGTDVEKFNFRAYYGQNFWGSIPNIPRTSSPFYGVSAKYTPCKNFAVGTELYGRQTPNAAYSPATTNADLWTRTFFGDSWSIDLGMSFGLNKNTPVRQYLVGITFSPPGPGEEDESKKKKPATSDSP